LFVFLFFGGRGCRWLGLGCSSRLPRKSPFAFLYVLLRTIPSSLVLSEPYHFFFCPVPGFVSSWNCVFLPRQNRSFTFPLRSLPSVAPSFPFRQAGPLLLFLRPERVVSLSLSGSWPTARIASHAPSCLTTDRLFFSPWTENGNFYRFSLGSKKFLFLRRLHGPFLGTAHFLSGMSALSPPSIGLDPRSVPDPPFPGETYPGPIYFIFYRALPGVDS